MLDYFGMNQHAKTSVRKQSLSNLDRDTAYVKCPWGFPSQYEKILHIIVCHIIMNWAGHVIRLEEQNPARRVLVAVAEGRRQRGRPKLRWEGGVKEDARKLGERNWRNAARNRDSWQKLEKKALAQNGLLCQ